MYVKCRTSNFRSVLFDSSKLNLGLGTEVTKLVLDFAFNILGYHKVYLRVLEYNKRAIRCYEKCGFIKEGKDREGAFIDGNYETDVYMAVLEDEYRKFSSLDLIKANNYTKPS
ncbi:GNAT family protein [Desulfosporosinus sp. PR]|uniref:GNAT family N-acetyltransferase n=1 Tax=Candidatus Desulfosporosinus nitrosoreducens TaxID=3401928 RepID=UPI0027FDE820|nr:GNAT family protein [Desulfosporosinus sp. PR]MDQ7096485.1 GNAT family protein [Desulfosporosinus sp. PR]